MMEGDKERQRDTKKRGPHPPPGIEKEEGEGGCVWCVCVLCMVSCLLCYRIPQGFGFTSIVLWFLAGPSLGNPRPKVLGVYGCMYRYPEPRAKGTPVWVYNCMGAP